MVAGTVTIFGGSGFLGRYIVPRLAELGWTVRVAVRNPDKAAFLKPSGNVGQVVPVACNLRDEASVRQALQGADAAVNLVGILFEAGRQTFAAVQYEGAKHAAEAAAAEGIARYVHMSALGADSRSASEYARSKAAAEEAVRAAIPTASILRPSVVFGPEDGFFNRFAAMAQIAPALPLVGGGRTRFQPVYVADVADAAVKCLADVSCAGKTYELGGPKIYSFKEMLKLLLRTINRRRLLVPLPFAVADIQGRFLELLPEPPLTRDQVKLLKQDNVVSPDALTLGDLGIEPHSAEVIIPAYLDRYRPGGRFNTRRPFPAGG